MKINYTIDDSNVIIGYIIKPFNETKPYIDINETELKKIRLGITKLVNGKLVHNEDLFLKRTQYKLELRQIDDWFKENDWRVNKIVIGEWTTDDERWTTYLTARANKRARQDVLNALLNADSNY